MGEAKRRQKLDPTIGQRKPNRMQDVEASLELAAQELLAESRAQAQAQAPFDAVSCNWVCSFGNENIAVDTLERCLDWIELEAAEREQVRQECLLEGYVEADDWDIQWNPHRAESLRTVYSVEVQPNGSLYVAP